MQSEIRPFKVKAKVFPQTSFFRFTASLETRKLSFDLSLFYLDFPSQTIMVQALHLI